MSQDVREAHRDAMERLFGWLAPWYDSAAVVIAPLRPLVVRFARLPPASRVLDVATGTGAQALAFGRRGHHVVGVDLVDAMLSIARAKAGDEGVQFIQMDAADLAFEPASFDAATIAFGLHEMPEPVRSRVLAEIARVVCPGGCVIVMDYAAPRHAWWRAVVIRFVGLWERGGFRDFLERPVAARLAEVGLVIEEERRGWLGAVTWVRARVPTPVAVPGP